MADLEGTCWDFALRVRFLPLPTTSMKPSVEQDESDAVRASPESSKFAISASIRDGVAERGRDGAADESRAGVHRGEAGTMGRVGLHVIMDGETMSGETMAGEAKDGETMGGEAKDGETMGDESRDGATMVGEISGL